MEDIKQEIPPNAPEGSETATMTESSTTRARPTIADLHGENHFAQVARKNWLGNLKAPKVRPEVVKKELWDELEQVDFAYSSLLVLENLQLLERYLWPGFDEDASNWHCLLLALMVNVKRRENLPSWGRSTCLPQMEDAHVRMKLTNGHRSLLKQTSRVFELLSPRTINDRRPITICQDPDTASLFHNRRLPIAGQRNSAQRMRATGRNIDMAEFALGRRERNPV